MYTGERTDMRIYGKLEIKKPLFLVSATIGLCFKQRLFTQFIVLSNSRGTVNVKFHPKLMGWVLMFVISVVFCTIVRSLVY